MGPIAKDFVKIAHAQKVDAIPNYMFLSNCKKKTALTILIKIAVRVPFKVF